MSITASCFFVRKDDRREPLGPVRGRARERERSGSRWSARSNARTNDLEAGASPRRMFQVVNGDSAPSSTILVHAWEREGFGSRLGCSGMPSPRLIGMMVFGHDREGSIT